MKNAYNEQENFWAGEFGEEYVKRNKSEKLLASNRNFFSKILSSTRGIESLIEFGANIGMNLKAISDLLPGIDLSAIEINEKAAKELEEWSQGKVKVYCQSILGFEAETTWDFVFVKGVLIHIHPSDLSKVYQKLYECSNRYLCIAEYYSPTPVKLNYRGYDERLFKRDFAGDLLDAYSDLELVDYGFSYRRDSNFPQDDIHWFLLEKK